MKRSKSWSLLLVIVGACQTPYQQMGWSGYGYKDEAVGPGRYLVTVKVNSGTERGTALEYVHRRAGELCPAGYDVESSTSGDDDAPAPYRSSRSARNGSQRFAPTDSDHEIAAMIRCTTGRPDAPAPDRRVPVEAAPYYCTSAPGASSIGECARTLDACAALQPRVAQQGGDAAACVEARVVVCFGYDREGHRKTRCAPTLGSCERSRADVAAERAVTACVNVAAGDTIGAIPLGPAPAALPIPATNAE